MCAGFESQAEGVERRSRPPTIASIDNPRNGGRFF